MQKPWFFRGTRSGSLIVMNSLRIEFRDVIPVAIAHLRFNPVQNQNGPLSMALANEFNL